MFGIGVGVGWIIALQRLADNPRSYLYTLAAMIAAYVMSESAGGSGPLSVLVFGVILGNADRLLGLLRRRGEADPADTSTIKAMLEDHEGTIQFVRTLVFTMVGLMLVPPAGPLVFGAILGVLLLVVRLLVVRVVLSGSDHAERSAIGNCAPRGMATVALATLPLAHQVQGSGSMLTLVFSAVTMSVVVFTIGRRHARTSGTVRVVEAPAVVAKPPVMRVQGPAVIAVDVRAPTMREQAEDELEVGMPTLAPIPGPAVTGRTVIPNEPALDVAPLLAVGSPPIALHGPSGLSGSQPQPAGPVEAAPQTGRTVVAEAAPQTGRTVVAEATPQTGRTVVAEAKPVGEAPLSGPSKTVIAEVQPVVTSKTVVATVTPRAPLVGMQEQPGGVMAALDREFAVDTGRAPEVYMPTLPTIDAAKAHGENPLDSAMLRALAKRPEDVNPRGGRTPGENEAAAERERERK
jgi:tetrahydromethanopterin S-methyltransferase subunit G